MRAYLACDQENWQQTFYFHRRPLEPGNQIWYNADMAEDVLKPGDRFRNYIIVKLLGKGGLGLVYLARHEMLDAYYALKILSPQVAEESPQYMKRFVREAKIATKIRHPNLVAVHDVGFDEKTGVYFLVMDYIQGNSLRLAIAMGGAMHHKEAVRITAEVASALAAGAAFGIVHRDIKPENIMLGPDGKVKLIDLGVAKIVGADSLKTAAQTVFGTPDYISPEQAVDSSSVDARADIYSLGIVLFEMLCGKRPYGDGNPTAVLKSLLSPKPIPDVRLLNPNVPQKLAMLLQIMCAKDPEKRIASSEALLETLEKFGYDVPHVGGSVYSHPVEESAHEIDFASLASGAAARPEADESQFTESDQIVSEFLESRRTRHRRRKMRIAVVVVLLLATVAALAFAAAWM